MISPSLAMQVVSEIQSYTRPVLSLHCVGNQGAEGVWQESVAVYSCNPHLMPYTT